jgi:cytochrome c-type biogenesis protein CcmH
MISRLLPAVLLAATLGLSAPAFAAAAQPTVADPALEARVLKLSEVLRCLVCQNQSIAESNAELAQDLRGQVREQLAAGKSEEEVVDYMVARYGDFVLYQPPVKTTTLILWMGPGLLLVAGLGWLAWRLRSRRREATPELSAEEHARARALLEGDGEEEQRLPAGPPQGQPAPPRGAASGGSVGDPQ